MLIAFDVGNTNITIGAYNKETKQWKRWRAQTDIDKTYDEIGVFLLSLFKNNEIDISKIEGIAVAPVVSDMMFNLETSIRKYLRLEPMIISADLDLGINLVYDNPKTIGIDRICNAVAAYDMYGGPVMVVDVGTAATISIVNQNGDFLGGVIIPGLKSMSIALNLKAPKLPRISIDKPTNVIGRSTVECINSGIVYGYASMIDGLINKIKKELKNENVTIVGTGGLIQFITEEVDNINEIYDDLTLEGIRMIYERNK